MSTTITGIVIEKGIPIPAKTKSRTSKYPFEELSVGDSIFVATEVKSTPSIVAAASRFRKEKQKSWEFTHVRTVNAKGEAGVRLWRSK